jgi:hypothetical protein
VARTAAVAKKKKKGTKPFNNSIFAPFSLSLYLSFLRHRQQQQSQALPPAQRFYK